MSDTAPAPFTPPPGRGTQIEPVPLSPDADAPVAFVDPDARIDLTNCDREPIHIPGAVQPYGVLLALREPGLEVAQASESSLAHLGLAARTLPGRPLALVLGEGAAERVRRMATGMQDRAFAELWVTTPDGETRTFDATLHRGGGLLLLELEPAGGGERVVPEQFGVVMRSVTQRLESANSLHELAQGMAEEMRAITGFDRVWVYKFHPDWHGEIIGEARRDDIETWLGMHYPASDIPAQARALFLRSWVRAIPDLAFVPSPLVPQSNPLTGAPLDLGSSVLRSVSPIHVQYLTNMGVTASLVISLIHRGKLWGLISGHHYTGTKHVPADVRALCEFLAQALSLQVGTADRLDDREYALEVRAAQSKLLARLADDETPEQVLTTGPVTLLDVACADGAAVVRQGRTLRVGTTPDDTQLDALLEFLRARRDDVYATTCLADDFPPAGDYPRVASGLLAVPLSRDRRDFVLWFRGEQRQTVRWAGDPRKPVVIAEDGSARLHPRGSFELWEEEARGTSTPWREIAREAALDVRRAVLDLLVRRAEEIALLNRDLELANAQLEESAVELETQAEELMHQRAEREELLVRERELRADAEDANKAKASFLAVMSHELRTPLNAIGGYAEIMSLGARGPVTEKQQGDLERIQVNQRHLLGLINSILNFTRLEAGQVQVTLERVTLAPLLHGLEALIGPQMRAKPLELTIDDCGAGAVLADEEKLRQILLNLLTNALKFTPAGGRVEVGCARVDGEVRVHVRDTGRGIPPEQLESVFEPFVQVDRHVTPHNDQGVGLGLAISRELARRMGGNLRAESEVGVGSVFTLTIPAG
ncbi:ATP-binding protein [Longimicrobium sp.]|uniref:ATP-binding protein n=1 Tax=Longimicrobium sp. TaxID=2029185 RepID=UPI003B3A7E81